MWFNSSATATPEDSGWVKEPLTTPVTIDLVTQSNGNLGQIASHNPNFVAREFDEVEPELEKGWAGQADRYGSWTAARRYAREAYARG